MRIKFQADLGGARIPMQIDIGFGDAAYPEPELASFPVLLPMEAPVIRAYPREARIAEKFHVMVVLDIRNTRMKDFYDISRSHIRHDDLCLAARCLSTRSSFPIHGIPAKQSL